MEQLKERKAVGLVQIAMGRHTSKVSKEKHKVIVVFIPEPPSELKSLKLTKELRKAPGDVISAKWMCNVKLLLMCKDRKQQELGLKLKSQESLVQDVSFTNLAPRKGLEVL